MNIQYNFRLGPEALWLILNTVLGAILTTLLTTDFTTIADWKAWAIGFAVSAGRTAIGAILATATGGGFQGPGQPGPTPTGAYDNPADGGEPV